MLDPAPHPTPGPSNAQTFKYATFDQVLDDLSCRFILNLPDEELRSIERVCFQVEQAHWFYEDFVRDVNPNLPSFPLRKFSAELFRFCPMLQHWSQVHEQAFDQFMAYKLRVPVCGAIMLNDKMDKCVLVKGFKSSSGWGFPKGKINQNERESDCAAREVLEETGYDLSSQMNEDDYFNTIVREQSITLFVVPGVPEDFPFKTRTRKEISKIEWFKLSDLPSWKRKRDAPGKFYLITPFIGQLKDFISRRRREPRMQQKEVSTAQILTTVGNGVKVNIHSTALLEQRSSSDESATPTKESSSLSSGNVGPTTPSPERSLFYDHKQNPDAQIDLPGGMDPHLANLLNNLNISANGISNFNEPMNGLGGIASNNAAEGERLSTRGASPSIESVSSNSIYTGAPSASNGVTSGQPSSCEASRPPSSHIPTKSLNPKRSKHIALLNSVVEDIELSSPAETKLLHSQIPSQQGHPNRPQPMNDLGRSASASSFAPYSHPYGHPSIPPPRHSDYEGFGRGQALSLGQHHQTESLINFPVFPTGKGVSPVHSDAYGHPTQSLNTLPHLNNSDSNPNSTARPLAPQSQVQMHPGSFPSPNGMGMPPPPLAQSQQLWQGSQPNGIPQVPPPGSQQSQLLALLSPRSRAVSHPQFVGTQQAPRAPPNHSPVSGHAPVPMHQSIYNSFLNGSGSPSVPAGVGKLLSSPLAKERDVAPNNQLLSILNKGKNLHVHAHAKGIPPPRPML